MKHLSLSTIFAVSILAVLARANADDLTDAERAFPASEPIATGEFEPTWKSLQKYETPEWFRDAKFGIWAHWTAQCVPEMGDWYARNMYMEGTPDYKYQVEHYGPPSKFGFKDIDHIWHAEHWEPEKLMQLYKRAGAQYFVALANHHDNFDCFDSKYQPWNSVNIGPRKDIVGLWAKAARAAGLRFGVTVHAARTWSWFEVTQGADKTGPLEGVPYDGKLTKADGKGLWWDGLDPQDLYAQNHLINARPDKAYCNKFYNRTIDLINKYQPDLLYFDDNVLPLRSEGEAYGLKIAAHLYNVSAAAHGGKTEAILNTKLLNEQQRQCMVWDIERGLAGELEPFAWQTDTCIGGWHYRRSTFTRHGYKSPDLVIHMLADIVSQNGNLLLNIPLRGDGTIDEDELKFLQDMAKWMDVNKESIIATRPWVIYGEGPSTLPLPPATHPANAKNGPNFNEGNRTYTSADVRFTTRGRTLYAILLGWPQSGTARIKALGTAASQHYGTVREVELLGAGPVKFEQTPDALEVRLPAQRPCDYAFALKIGGAS
jgi:alpha-L-fucosidase